MHLLSLLAGVSGLLLAATAGAQSPPYAAPEPPAIPPQPSPHIEPQHARRHNRVFSPWEVSLTTGGGVTDYFGSGFTASSSVGAAWDAQLTVGTRSLFAFEASYLGSVNALNTTNSDNGHLTMNGFDSDLRINLLPYRVQPYVFGGVGYAHLHVDNANGNAQITSKLNNDVDQFTVPAGAGLSTYIAKHATIDLRGTYHLMPDNKLTAMSTGDSIHSWTAAARVGYAF
jgi:hypothetical protein